jgi:signal transduction histidine kinase/CheY-like chemotaxis protein
MNPSPAPAPLSSKAESQIQLHQFITLQSNVPFIVLGSLLVATALLWVLNEVLPLAVLLVWSGLLVGHALVRLACWWWLRNQAVAEAQVRRRIHLHTVLSLASGLLWGGGALCLLQYGEVEHRLLVTLMLAGMVSSSLISQTIHLPTFHGFFLPCAVSAVAGNLMLGNRLYQAVALTIFAYSLLAARFARTLNDKLTESLRARFQIADLAERLHVQKEAAEQANLAKSRFLAAASHDLRQPIHAQGLFLDVLSRTPLSAYQSEVLVSTQSAWRASSDMLNTLLDFSRIEAGVVHPQVQPFLLQELLYQIENDFAPLADAKGLVYRSRETRLAVQSDAILVGMVVRNLVSNAIRYTQRGGLLVACRKRRHTVSIEVWDTGIGIAPADQQAIFREFHQLGNPERDRHKGLGLGLAIADGLAKSMGHGLTLSSKPERGSVFRLELPLSVAPVPPPLQKGPQLQPMRVLVIDDDATVRSAMVHLLQSWGCPCDNAESLEEALPLVLQTPPACIISDYRLRGPRTGAHAIAELRQQLHRQGRRHTPALIITGDTAPERLREALASGIPLLHKPISPEQLYRALAELQTDEHIGTA